MAPPQFFGLKELYKPREGPVDVDIVAVHGLTGDAIGTWTSEPGKVCWLSDPDMLPKFVKRARVLTWGYNANITSFAGRTTSSDRILQHAYTLIANLSADREMEDANNRPLIFLCHSLGGIIVKRALAYAESRDSSMLSHYHSIYTCTFGIIFFGTPHNGSSKAGLLGNLQKLASIAIPKASMQIESQLVNALETDSETLQNITDQFAPLMPKFRIFFLWEQEKSSLKYTKEYIVEEKSAAPILDNTERCAIAADHSTMCKFAKNSDQGFRTVVAALKRYEQQAPEVIRNRCLKATATSGDNRRHEALEMLRGVQPSPLYAFQLQEGVNRIENSSVPEQMLVRNEITETNM